MHEPPAIQRPEYQVAWEAARRGAPELVNRFRTKVAVQTKGVANFVSEADLAAEAAVIKTIRDHYPDHAILSEESHQSLVGNAEHLWVIDPLDGTNNFLHGIPHFAISIGYYHHGVPQVGLVLNPISNDLYSVAAGEGAWWGKTRQFVSQAASLDELVVACGFYYDRQHLMQATLDSLSALYKAQIHGMRRFGAAALDLCHVGCGQFGMFFEYKLSPWDFAAGRLFVSEAGGTCTDCDGESLPMAEGSSVCATNGRVHQAALNVLAPHWTKLKSLQSASN